ncbi:unnamed protein product [Prorocentrum cordatum]|uniref:Tyrosine-protein kinase ephrin type A/B receptor-like domain-containing protein n=1 Tax=Prorocentrum cordatum TaxID=2364126 RepID=A0ABN9V1F2_9DINO|nr:unnamed protein product [Polarella glacialis]
MPSEDDHLLLQWLLADTEGIAYFGYAYYAQFTDTVAAIAIATDTELGVTETLLAKIAPDSESIVDGSYSAFKRDLYMNVHNNAWNVSGDLLLFGFSDNGQELVKETGYVTVNRDQHADMSVRIGVSVTTRGNLAVDYVPAPPDSCAVGSCLISWPYTNDFGTDKTGYACKNCTVGTAENNDESSPCDPCPPGFFTNETGQTTCEPCPQGFATTEHGSNSCSMCPLNEHQPLPGQGSCLACSAGRFTELPGQSACMSCALDTYMFPGGNYTCETCPAGMTTIERAATDKESCKCAEGTYLMEGGGLDGPCAVCPDGMQCAFGSTFSNFFAVDGSLKAASDDDQPFPVVEEGYMTWLDDLLRVFKCLVKNHWPGGAPATCARGRDSGEVACAR